MIGDLVVYNSWKSAYYYADRHGDDFENFRQYAARSVDFLVEHHDAEEAALFPRLEKEFPQAMERNHAQHESFLNEVGGKVTSGKH